jgi:DNA-binding response OmpR family regulator
MAELIVVVDDDTRLSSILEILLDRKGYAVRAVPSVDTALELLETITPTLFILDVHMPDGNGIDLCRQLRYRRDTRHIPVIMFSSDDDMRTIQQSLDAGAAAFVSKADPPQYLLKTMQLVMQPVGSRV